MLQVGSVVDGKYVILREIGRGGMSVVYLALNERANKTWAIKEVRKNGATDFETTRQGLIAETNILKKLRHPNIVSIIDVLDYQDSFLIVMDYIEGRSLQDLLNEGGAQPAEKVIEWGKKLCDVMGYLHSRKPPIIYRDMKPANVMLRPDGDVILTDFGTAREFKGRQGDDTTCLGTVGYAAPEQFGGHGETDARTDIYCLGVTMYHLISGHGPTETNSIIEPLRHWDPRFAETGIEAIIMKCCQPRKEDRYQTDAELMYALEHVHDFDKSVVRARRRKWGAFLGCCIASAACLVGMVGFRIAENSATTQSYDYYLQKATSMGDTITAKADSLYEAMRLDPTNVEAYTALMDAIDNDNVFTSEENDALNRCIMATPDGDNRTNLSKLKNRNAKAWASFVYRMANDYYFFYETTDNRTKAAGWYKEVKDDQNLTEEQRNLASSLYTIGEYYSSLGSDADMYKADSAGTYNYNDLWNSMVALTDGDIVSKTGGTRYAVGLYKEFVYQIYTNASKFKSFGISGDEVEQQLQKIESALPGLAPENDTVRQQIAQVESNIAQARLAVRAAYQTVGG